MTNCSWCYCKRHCHFLGRFHSTSTGNIINNKMKVSKCSFPLNVNTFEFPLLGGYWHSCMSPFLTAICPHITVVLTERIFKVVIVKTSDSFEYYAILLWLFSQPNTGPQTSTPKPTRSDQPATVKANCLIHEQLKITSLVNELQSHRSLHGTTVKINVTVGTCAANRPCKSTI